MKLIIFTLLILGMALAQGPTPNGQRWPGLFLDSPDGKTLKSESYIGCPDGWAWSGYQCKRCDKNKDGCCFQWKEMLKAMKPTQKGCKHILFSFLKSK
jgi:hypothetical protein